MHAATKGVKDAIAALGIPRRAIRAVTGMNQVTHATVLDPAHVALVAERADELAGPWLGVVIKRFPCGCLSSVRVTTDPRHVGRVDTIPVTSASEHHCENSPAPTSTVPGCVPNRREAETALATYHRDGGRPAELTGRYVSVNRLDSAEPPIVLYEIKDADDTAWLDPAGFSAAISLTEYFET